MPPTHYDTLGVSRQASVDEIKTAFRKLSLETHPDVAGPDKAHRFKEISEAASVLTNASKKHAYDSRLDRPLSGVVNWGDTQRPRRPNATDGFPRPTNGFQVFLQTIFRPRNMLFGSIALYTTVTTARYYLGYSSHHTNNIHASSGNSSKVQAWKNPVTGQWEQPAPWDPTYRRLKPHLTMVPREQVKTRTR
jgi:DnaJ-class molecular chaperone